MSLNKLASPSIVLEWETVEEGGLERAIRGLREISEQIAELQPRMRAPAEVIVCYERQIISERELRGVFEVAAGKRGWVCPVHLIAVAESTHYYEKKNVGGRASVNEIIIFLDTDLIPDPGWLENLLSAFDDWSTCVLIGATHLDHASTYEMAVALFWIFDPATAGRGVQPLRRYSSNNLAFRRPVFLKFLFPTLPTYRGQCGELARRLLDVGISINEHTDARSTHPPPAWMRGFVHRAWSAGKDEQFYAALRQETSPRACISQLLRDYRTVAKRIRERSLLLRPRVGAVVLGWILGWLYYGIKSTGYFASLRRVGTAEAHQHYSAVKH